MMNHDFIETLRNHDVSSELQTKITNEKSRD